MQIYFIMLIQLEMIAIRDICSFFCRVRSEDYGVVGVRYGSENLSVGGTFVPIPCIHLSTTKTPLSFSIFFIVGLLTCLGLNAFVVVY